MKSRKSLAGKISTLNEDRYRTPVSKIYQPQETEARYRKRSTSIRRDRERLRTKESKDGEASNQPFEKTQSKRTLSSHAFRKHTLDANPPYRKATLDVHSREIPVEGFRQRQMSGAVSVGKLKL